MNKVFLSRYPDRIIPLARVLPPTGIQLPDMAPTPWTDNGGSLANKVFGALPEVKPQSQAQVAIAGSSTQEGSDSVTNGSAATPATQPAPQSETVAVAKPTSSGPSEGQAATIESQPNATAQPKPVLQHGANAAAPPAGDETARTPPAPPEESFLGRWTRRLLATINW
jgi:hypothetical protein